jgi:hypothetical protein
MSERDRQNEATEYLEEDSHPMSLVEELESQPTL